MKYRIGEIKLKIGEDRSVLPEKIAKKIGRDKEAIIDYKIIRESIDARDKDQIRLVYTVDFQLEGQLSGRAAKLGLKEVEDREYAFVEKGTIPMKNRPVIAGFGPCGLFAALILSEMGYRPLILERGQAMEQRVAQVQKFWQEGLLNTESNVQFGEGGAGTFSDGKLTTQIKDPRISKVLQEMVQAGADEDILYKQKPHMGTDVLRRVVVNLRKKVLEKGGEIRFGAKVTDLRLTDGALSAVEVNGEEWIPTENLVLAVGHSARDTFRMLNQKGMELMQKPFSIGVRIEHPQQLIDKAQYGRLDTGLGAAEYKLAHRCENGRGVYTFCMCPGGQVVVASSQEGGVVTNGMSFHARDGAYANSALLVDVRTSDFGSDDPLAGVEFQETYERKAFAEGGGSYQAPKATWKAFENQEVDGIKVRNCLPPFAVDALLEAMPHLGRKLKGFDSPEALLTAVETRSSSPVRMIRDEFLESPWKGVYPGGEGAGYAGGITSAAVDGIKLAEKIAERYSPAPIEQQTNLRGEISH